MDMMEENWLPIVGYEGLYEVSDLGRVKSFARYKDGKILKPSIRKDGYCKTLLGKKNQYLVHRLVLQTFLPIVEIKEVNHKNHIRNDNRLENLEWCSRSENMRFKKKCEGYSSQYKGLYWHKKSNKWMAQGHNGKKSYYLGCFDDEREAAKAYNEFIIKHNLQDFAILNDLT